MPALLHKRCFSVPFLTRQRRWVMVSSQETVERVSRWSTRQLFPSSFRYFSLPRRTRMPPRGRRHCITIIAPLVASRFARAQRTGALISALRGRNGRRPAHYISYDSLRHGQLWTARLRSRLGGCECCQWRACCGISDILFGLFYFRSGLSPLFLRLRRRQTPRSRRQLPPVWPLSPPFTFAHVSGLQPKPIRLLDKLRCAPPTTLRTKRKLESDCKSKTE